MSRILDTIARRKNNEKKSDVKFELNRLISVRIETETNANNFQKKNNTTTIHSKATQLNQIKRRSKTIDKKLITTILSRNNIHYSSR